LLLLYLSSFIKISFILTKSLIVALFLSYKDLLPKLTAPSIIVLDNASFHKASLIQEAISDAGHILEFLPPYSPQLNPIEHKWAQAKALRKQKHSSITEFFSLYSRSNIN